MSGVERAKVDFGKDQEVIMRLQGKRGTAKLWVAMLQAGYLAAPAQTEGPEEVEPEPSPAESQAVIDALQDRIDLLEEVLAAPHKGGLLIADIIKAACLYYRISKTDMLSHRRSRSIVRPRQVAMYLAKKLTTRSLPEIGRKMGDKDHTTVLYAVRKVEQLMQYDPEIRADVEALKAKLAA
jgi:hypothetical protein